jgi:hypothetical protein
MRKRRRVSCCRLAVTNGGAAALSDTAGGGLTVTIRAGLPVGTCQDALDTACGLYLNDPTAWT